MCFNPGVLLVNWNIENIHIGVSKLRYWGICLNIGVRNLNLEICNCPCHGIARPLPHGNGILIQTSKLRRNQKMKLRIEIVQFVNFSILNPRVPFCNLSSVQSSIRDFNLSISQSWGSGTMLHNNLNMSIWPLSRFRLVTKMRPAPLEIRRGWTPRRSWGRLASSTPSLR